MASYSSMAAIKKAIQKETKAAMKDAQKKMLKKRSKRRKDFTAREARLFMSVLIRSKIHPRPPVYKDLGIFWSMRYIWIRAFHMKSRMKHLLQEDFQVILPRLKFLKLPKVELLVSKVNLDSGRDQKRNFKTFLIRQWHSILIKGEQFPRLEEVRKWR